jgi:diguanylate cyclase (GGDEF)-like protein
MSADNTLFYVDMVLTGLCGLSWAAMGGSLKPVRRSSLRFALANFCFGAGVLLLESRTPQPSYLHYHVVEWLVFLGLAAFHSGILTLVILPKPPSGRQRAVPIVLAVCATALLAPDPSSFQVRAVVFSFTVAWLSIACFRDCYRGLRGEQVPAMARGAISGPFLLVALVMGARGVLTLAFPPVVDAGAFVQVPAFTPFLWALTILLLGMNNSLVGLSAGRLVMQISALADRDYLTGCLNRRALEKRLQIEFDRTRRSGEPLACVFFDLDHFKRINDVHGHGVGDQVLKHSVQVIQQHLRAVDALGRFGGEEFMVLMPDTPLAGAQEAANRMRLALLDSPLRAGDKNIALSASFGVAVLGNSETQEGLLHRADSAMYEAKRLGRNRVEIAAQ